MVRKKNVRKKNSSGRTMLWILLGLAVCIIIIMVSIYPAIMTGAPRTAYIRIPAGATEKNVADSLEKYFGHDFASTTMKLIGLRHTDFTKRHGAYEITEGSNPLSAMRKLTSGAQTPIRITVNGFRSLDLLTSRISAKMDFTADSLRAVVSDPDVLRDYGLTPENALALFADDSYDFFWNASPEKVVRKIGDNYLKIWNAERTRKAALLGLTPAQVTTLASIVDEETNNAAEKGTVGRLYINRLNKGMRLQADPTVRFAVGDFTIRRVTGKYLGVESPYNTYRHAGLPPGPIRTTSAATIDAILDSKPNDYIYMCAKEDFSGSHNFSVTFEEHQRNAARYQSALDRRGIQK